MPRSAFCVLVLSAPALGQIDASHDSCATAFGPVGSGIYPVDTTMATVSGVQPVGLPPYVDFLVPATACDDFGVPGLELSMNADIWLEFVPDLSVSYVFSTCNSAGWDSKLAIYSGGCGNLIALACNDDGPGCPGGGSQLLTPSLTSGSTYFVQIGALFGSGTALLNVVDIPVPPVNDDCSGALELSLGTNLQVINTQTATVSGVPAAPLPPYVDDATPDTGCPASTSPGTEGNLNLDVWFTFVPQASGDYLFSTCGMATFNTRLALFSGTCGNEVALACNADAPGCGITSQLRVSGLLAGQTYLLVVGSDFFDTGGGSILIALENPNAGSNYCIALSNSVAPNGAIMHGAGSPSVAANDLVLRAGPIETGQSALFYYGPDQIIAVFGDGVRCIGGAPGSVQRLHPFVTSDLNGQLSYAVDNTLPIHASRLQPGTTWSFQAWYRDPAALGSGFNLSDGLELTFEP